MFSEPLYAIGRKILMNAIGFLGTVGQWSSVLLERKAGKMADENETNPSTES